MAQPQPPRSRFCRTCGNSMKGHPKGPCKQFRSSSATTPERPIMPGAFDGDRPSIMTGSPARLIDRLGPKLEPDAMEHSFNNQQALLRAGNARRASAPFERVPTLLNDIEELGPEHSISQRAHRHQMIAPEYTEGHTLGSPRPARLWNDGRRRLSLQERLGSSANDDFDDSNQSVIASFTDDLTMREVLQTHGAIALATLYSVKRINVHYVQVAAEREGLCVNIIPPPPQPGPSSSSSATSEVVWVVFSQNRIDGHQLAIGHGRVESSSASGTSDVRHRAIANPTTTTVNDALAQLPAQTSAQPIQVATNASKGNPFSGLSSCQMVTLLLVTVFVCNIASYLFFFALSPF